MKKQMKNLPFLLVLLVNFFANANEGITIQVKENQTIAIEVDGKEKNGILTLKNEKGELFFKDCLMAKKEPYNQSLDLESLSEGLYHLTLEDKYHIYTSVITKNPFGITLQKGLDKKIYKPKFRIEGKKVKFHLTNISQAKVEVKVLDSLGKQIGIVESKDLIIARSLDFSQVPSGTYIIAVHIGSHTIIEKLAL